jgi:hypothetical protein
MRNQRGSAVLLCTVLVVSIALLAWSIASTWRQESAAAAGRQNAAQQNSVTNSHSAQRLPPPLQSDAAKASLFYPLLKARGPQPGGSLVSKPLIQQPLRETQKP